MILDNQLHNIVSENGNESGGRGRKNRGQILNSAFMLCLGFNLDFTFHVSDGLAGDENPVADQFAAQLAAAR